MVLILYGARQHIAQSDPAKSVKSDILFITKIIHKAARIWYNYGAAFRFNDKAVRKNVKMVMRLKPIIGLTAMYTELDGMKFFKTNDAYVQAVLRAGGIPVLLPVTTTIEEYEQYAESLDGLLIPGGADVSPSFYGEEPVPEVTVIHRNDDAFEFALVRKMAQLNKPILGICRGHQVINVAFGGSLYQDLPSQYGKKQCHCQSSTIRSEPFHTVTLKPESRVAEIFGDTVLETNTFHHQAVKEAAPSFHVVGTAKDGVVEAIEHESKFIVGLQWHPEGMAVEYPQFQKIFNALVAEAEKCKK